MYPIISYDSPISPFTAQWLTFDLSCTSRLNWTTPPDHPFIAYLNMGLFDKLSQPLHDEGQLNTLDLATQHFVKEIYTPNKENCKGICLYQGELDFSFPWIDLFQNWVEEENIQLTSSNHDHHLLCLFARNCLLDYLNNFLPSLPVEPPLMISFDTRSITSKAAKAELLSMDVFEHYQLMLRPGETTLPCLALEEGYGSLGYLGKQAPKSLSSVQPPDLGICLPSSPWDLVTFKKMEQLLENETRPYRLIPQANLHLEWEGLEKIIVLGPTVPIHCQRQCLGFEAAGGVVEII